MRVETGYLDGLGPVNGIDTSKWNGTPTGETPSWLKYYGMKALDVKYDPIVDEQFNVTRERVHHVRWKGMYIYVRPEAEFGVSIREQIHLLSVAVERLVSGEFVFLDIEEAELTALDVDTALHWATTLFPGRVGLYLNDNTPEFARWWKERWSQWRGSVPIIYPQYNEHGFWEANAKHAAIWQVGVGINPGTHRPKVEVPYDLVLDWDALDAVCDL